MSARKYYCRECEASLTATREEALAEIANGHTLFTDPEPMPAKDALADAETLRINDKRLNYRNARRAAVHRDCPPVTVYDLEGWWIMTCARAAFNAVPGLRA